MKILKRTKKGFTLVELIVVIAIVAILAAVSVVSYLAFINQANESADIQLVKQLNTALQADEALNGPRDTMHEMLGAMEENGFVVENLTKTKSGYDIVWDQNSNRFALLDNKEDLIYGEDSYKNSETWQIWKFADTKEEAENKEYSVYLTEEFANANVSSLDVKAGLDVGSYIGLATINYTSSATSIESGHTVTVRSSDGTLKIDAEYDTVHHYSYLDKLQIEKIAANSYHEHGIVRVSATVNQGHLVVEENGSISELNIPQTSENVEVTVANNGSIETLVNDNASASISVQSGAKIGQAIGETSGITGEGASSIREVEKTYVYNVGDENKLTLMQAVNAAKEYIVFAEDISTNDVVNIDYNVTIDGAGHKLTTSNYRTSDARSLNVGNSKPNVTATIKNLNIVGPTGGYSRAVNIITNNVSINIFDCVITAGHYPINVCSNAHNFTCTIINSEISGYCALNIWAYYNEITVLSSVLTGINNNSGSSSNFATICFEADTTLNTDLYSHNNVVRVKNSTINAIENSTCIENIVNYNNGTVGATGHLLVTDNCVFNSTNGNAYACSNYSNSWINNGEEMILNSATANVTHLSISDDGASATGSIKLFLNNYEVECDLASATVYPYQDGSGTDYILECKAGKLVYNIDLDICSMYSTGYTIYVYRSASFAA